MGTHQNFKVLGTGGYRVQARKKFWVPLGTGYQPKKNLGTDGYQVPARQKILGTNWYRVPTKFLFIPTPGPKNEKKYFHFEYSKLFNQFCHEN